MDPAAKPDLHALLKRTAVFGHLHDHELDALLQEMAWLWSPGGAPVYLRGEASDALYVVKSGSLGMFDAPSSDGSARPLGIVTAGATLGEIGLISGAPRQHGVWALRDSELLRLSRDSFDRLVTRHPTAMLGAAREAVQRLLHDPQEGVSNPPRTFAILPFDQGIDARSFAGELERQLRPWGRCTLIDAGFGRDRSTDWFAAREAECRFVIYLADGDVSWQRLCQRQADALVLLADATRAPEDWPYQVGHRSRQDTATATEHVHHRPRHLVLRHPRDRFVLGAARAWRAQLNLPGLQHHHWRGTGDVARMARLWSGRAIGLVLSGGGARGFAQIGVIQALRETGITVDVVVGTSIGAIIGAGIASEWTDMNLRKACRRALVDGKPLSDWTLPLVALTRGARTTLLLREAFGEIDIEDLPLPFACVSADLTLGTTVVHREGRLWQWLRASSAVPGILPPLFHGGHVYVDGAVINNLPTDALAGQNCGRMIAVDIGTDESLAAAVEEAASPSPFKVWSERKRPNWRPGAFSILLRAGMVNSEAGTAQRAALADLLLRPDVQQIGLFDWHKFDHAIVLGYRHTRDALRADAASMQQRA